MRSKNLTPTAREFKYTLKIICAAQYLKEVKSSNYELDERQYLGDLLPCEIIIPCASLLPSELNHSLELSNSEQESLYYLAGYCIQSLIKLNQLCDSCARLLKAVSPHEISTFLHPKNFKDGALFEVSVTDFKLMWAWAGP